MSGNAYLGWIDRDIIMQLNGRVEWRFSGLSRHWAKTSSCAVKIVVEGTIVRLLGKWEKLTGVLMGKFATEQLAIDAAKLIADDIRFTTFEGAKDNEASEAANA